MERALNVDQLAVVAILLGTVGLFVWGRWRHDMVAVAALLAVVLAGLVPAEEAFTGFGHPAVITVACVLILSSGLQNSGAVDRLAREVLPAAAGPFVTITALTSLAAVLSAFMNNVGALALLMPLAIQVSGRLGLQPGQILMPLAFGSILGGMTTLIGTPPNLVVSAFRAQATGAPYGMFDFAPVGVAVAVAGILFICTFGRWLIPIRKRAQGDGFGISAYLTEARIGEESTLDGKTLREVELALDAADAQVIGLVRDDIRLPGPHPSRRVHTGDVLVIEAEPEALAKALSTLELTLVDDQPEAVMDKNGKDEREVDAHAGAISKLPDPATDRVLAPTEAGDNAAEEGETDEQKAQESKRPDDQEVVLAEFAVLPGSAIVGRSASDLHLRTRFGINLLAVSRQGRRTIARLRTLAIREGDVLLLQGVGEALSEFGTHFGCLPLAERPLRLPNRKAAYTAGGIMAAAIVLVVTGLMTAAVAFAGAVLAVMVARVVLPKSAYQAVDWPVIVLLGALLALAGAMETTGTADLIARVLLDAVARGDPIIALVVILVVTMVLTDFMNNAATVAVVCPIAISAASGLEVNPDAFLMAVAIGGSCAFMTPIGHQNNTLILGPSGFRFGDYWRLGLPLQLVIIAVAVPMILFVWPL